ncbi:MAG: hypothetical protein ACOZEN_16180 [Thermodesulfobacteriota bacterium]
MNKEKYTGKVTVEGKDVPFDPVNRKVLDVCHRCGFELEAEVEHKKEEKEGKFMGYACPKCNYWYGID